MTTIGAAGFEGAYGATWSRTYPPSSWHYTGGASWYTEGTNSVRFGFGTANAGDNFLWYQTINFDSDFTLLFDYNVYTANSDIEVRVYVDSDLKFNSAIGSLAEFLNQSAIITGYRGNHVLKIGLYCTNDGTTGNPGIEIDNLRVTSEVANKYVDISTGDDTDSGETWVSAYQTVKKGLDEIPDASYSVLHIAEGDYSAQAAIDLDKTVAILCEDYGGGNASPPLTVTLPATT